VYLELNKHCFEILLEWLRARAINPKAPAPVPPKGKGDIFQYTVDFLQLPALEATDGMYFKVVQNTVFTDQKETANCKVLRVAQEGEVVKMLEGPVCVNGITRVLAESVATWGHGAATKGWLTFSGNQGAAYLEKCNRPMSKRPR